MGFQLVCEFLLGKALKTGDAISKNAPLADYPMFHRWGGLAVMSDAVVRVKYSSGRAGAERSQGKGNAYACPSSLPCTGAPL